MNFSDLASKGQSFLFGPGTEAPSYEALKRRREIADLLMKRTMSTQPKNIGEGLSMLGQAILARRMNSKLGGQEDAHRKDLWSQLSGLGGGFTGQGGYSGDPATLSSSGGASAPTGATPSLIRQEMLERGLPEHVADGFLMNFQDESGFDPDINERNPIAGRGGKGLYQLTGPRREAYEAKYGDDYSVDNQMDFLVSELKGPESAAAQRILSTKGPGEAAAAITNFFLRPAPEHAAERTAKYTGEATPFMEGAMTGIPGPGSGPDMGKITQIGQILSDPYADEGMKMVAQAMIQQLMGQQMTPYQSGQLGLGLMDSQNSRDRLEAEQAEAAIPDAPGFGLNLQYATGPDGELHAYQVTDQGGIKEVELPEGAEWAPGVGNVDTGTGTAQVNRRTGQVESVIPKDIAGAEAAKVVGESGGKAAASLGDREISVRNTIETIDRVASSPELESVTGMFEGWLPGRNQAQTDTIQDVKKLVEQTFPEAITSLVGMGAMSNMEGVAAKQSIADLSRVRGGESFRAELGRLKALLLDKLEVAKQKAATATGGQTGNWMVDTDPSTWTEEQKQEAERAWGLR